MGFNPTTDVVLDVLNAADPARASLAAERLAALAAGAPGGDFSADLDKAEAAAKAQAAAPAVGFADARKGLEGVAAASSDPAARAKVEFEAMALDGFVGELLPKDASAFFGTGAAGDVWRSMLSEQIARQIARSGALGLSRRLFATHEVVSGKPQHAGAAPAAIAASANVLSAPAAADIVEGAILSTRRGRG